METIDYLLTRILTVHNSQKYIKLDMSAFVYIYEMQTKTLETSKLIGLLFLPINFYVTFKMTFHQVRFLVTKFRLRANHQARNLSQFAQRKSFPLLESPLTISNSEEARSKKCFSFYKAFVNNDTIQIYPKPFYKFSRWQFFFKQFLNVEHLLVEIKCQKFSFIPWHPTTFVGCSPI